MEDLIQYVPEYLIARVHAGELELLPGQREDKPVIREVATGRLVPGSGRYPRANDPAALGRATAYKHSNNYRQAFELLFPLEGGEDKPGSMAWVAKMCREAAEGSPQSVNCPSCGERSVVAFKKDGVLLFKILELLVGKARETQDLNVKSESLIAVLNAREDIKDIIIHAIDPRTAQERRAIIEQDD